MAETIMCQNKPLALIAGDAKSIYFDNSNTDLSADNVQDAIEESLIYDPLIDKTIKEELDEKLSIYGGTIKGYGGGMLGNGTLIIEGHSASDWGVLDIGRNSAQGALYIGKSGEKVFIEPKTLTDFRTQQLPDESGMFRLGSADYGAMVTSTGGGGSPYQWNYAQTFDELANNYFNDSNIKQNTLRVSSIGGFQNVMFRCAYWNGYNETLDKWDCQWVATTCGYEYDITAQTHRNYISTFIVTFNNSSSPLHPTTVTQWKIYQPISSYTTDTVIVDFTEDTFAHQITIL